MRVGGGDVVGDVGVEGGGEAGGEGPGGEGAVAFWCCGQRLVSIDDLNSDMCC